MFCKFNSKCRGGQIWENDVFVGRCECKRMEIVDFFADWAKIPSKTKKLVEEIKPDDNIFMVKDRNNVKKVDNVKMIQQLSKKKDELIEKQGTIVMKGLKGTGKTQHAITLALEMIRNIDMTKSKLQHTRFLYLSLSEIIHMGKLYDQNFKQELERKVQKTDILILDDAGEELEIQDTRNGTDKRKTDSFGFLTALLNKFEGLLIVTSNLPNIERAYQENVSVPRLQSRLIGNGKGLLKIAFEGNDKRKDQEIEAFDDLDDICVD